MKKFAKFISTHSKLILIISLMLLVPAIYGYVNTRINYDILVYLPDSVDTIKGENILTDDFGLGAYAFVIADSTNTKKMLELEKDIKKIEGVNEVISLADITDTTIPVDMLPSKVTDALNKDNETIILVTFNGSTSEDVTINAVRELREVTKDATKVSSMTSMVIDTMDVSNKEMLSYIIIAVIFCLAILLIATDSYVIPFLLLGNIGFAITYNMGTNIFLGQISYITQAITAILQLGVTMDFSIFLYHKYEQAKLDNPNDSKYESMTKAIVETFQSVIGSSLTTFAGFLALCTMSLTLGTDIGIVMAKGVLWGLICVLTLFPSLLIVFDKLIDKTKHKNIFPEFKKIQKFCINHYKGIIVVFLILMIPAIIGNNNYKVYYKLDESLPKDLAFNVANSELSEKFNIVSPEIILLNKNVKTNDVKDLTEKLKQIDGIDLVLSPSTFLDEATISLLPSELSSMLENDKYQLIILNSTYEIASDELSNQISEVSKLVKSYDKDGIIAGEGPLMDDLVTIADHDFKMVNYTSIIVIFIIMVLVLKQINLPIILILTIEFAIFVNMSVSYYTNVSLPFIASIVVGTIQLGATIDYAILMSTKYLEERKNTKDKKEAMLNTLKLTVPSIMTSALCFFAATFGVAIYTQIDMIGSICELLARGSIISMLVVILILPSLLIVCDKLIFKNKKEGKNMKKLNKIASAVITSMIIMLPLTASATSKTETVYANLDYKGDVNKITVNNHLYVKDNEDIEDYSVLTNILNVSGNENFTTDNNKITWKSNGNDIFYQGSTNEELPLNVVVKYYFDGEEVDAKDIIGKSGKIKIEVSLLNNSLLRTNNTFTPLVVGIGTMLNNENNSNITITNGKTIDTGSKNIAIAISTPGLYEFTKINEFKDLDKVVLEYETKDFELNEMYLVASPKLLEETDLSIFEKLDSLSSSINTLSEKMDELEAGAEKLENGSTALLSGTNELSDNLKTAKDSLRLISQGSLKLNDGIDEIIKTLNETKKTLEDKNINESLQKLSVLKASNNKAIQKLANKEIDEIYKTYKLNTFATDEELIAYLKTIPDMTSEKIENIVSCKNNYELRLLLSSNNDAINNMEENLQELNKMLVTLDTKLVEIEEMKTKVSYLTTNLSKLSVGLEKLYAGSVNVTSGMSEITNGVTSLHQGISSINSLGIKSLVNYTNKAIVYKNEFTKIANLSKNYNGFSTNNADKTTFIIKLNNN